MASIMNRGSTWRAQVFVKGKRTSKTFSTESDARAWASGLEAKLKKRSDLETLISVGAGLPGFPRRIIEAMRDIPLGREEIIQGAISSSVVCGIYFLIRDEEIVYVGQSTNTLRRVARHVDDGRKFDYFTIVPCKREDLDRMEHTYITALYPDENMTLGNSLRLMR